MNRGLTRRWTAWTERQIARIVIDEGLAMGAAQVVRGPVTVSFRCRLLRPNKRDLTKILGLGPAMAQALQVDGVRIDNTAGGIVIEVPLPDQLVRTPTGPQLARHTKRLFVALGLDQWRRPAAVNLSHNPAVAFVGPTRRGKTSAMRAALYALISTVPADRLSYVIVSEKRKDWAVYGDLAGCLGIAADPDEGANALNWISAHLTERAAGRSPSWPAVVVICDDLISLLKKRPDLDEPLATLASMGGGENIFTWLGTQDAGSKSSTGGMAVEANITARVVYKPTTATTAARAAGFGSLNLDQLSGHKGDALLIVDGRVRRIATGHVDDTTVATLPAGGTDSPPWSVPERVDVPHVNVNGAGSTPTTGSGLHTGTNGAYQRDPGSTASGTPILQGEPRTGLDRDVVLRTYRSEGSKNKACVALWGKKTPKTLRWLNECLEGIDKDLTDGDRDLEGGDRKDETVETGDPVPDWIDLETEDGRRTLESLKASGLLSWPDPDTLVETNQHEG